MQDVKSLDFKSLIDDITRRSGLTPSEIARKAGLHPSTLTRQFPVRTANHSVSMSTIAKLRRAFPESEQESWSLEPAPARVREEPAKFEHAGNRRAVPLFHLKLRNAADSEGDAELGDLELMEGDLDQPVSHIDMPWLPEDDRYFAMFMPGDSMAPRFRPGEKLLLDRLRPAPIGSEVLVEITGTREQKIYCIAQMAERDRNTLQLKQYGFQASGTVHRSRITASYLIVGLFED